MAVAAAMTADCRAPTSDDYEALKRPAVMVLTEMLCSTSVLAFGRFKAPSVANFKKSKDTKHYIYCVN